MGQLDVYSLDDISLVTLMFGPFSSYISEEIEVSIESVVAYIYSNSCANKKRAKLKVIGRPAGELFGAIYTSLNVIPLYEKIFLPIYKPIDRSIMWQDPFLSQWEGKADRENLARLDSKYKW